MREEDGPAILFPFAELDLTLSRFGVKVGSRGSEAERRHVC
jgi:hypothetical protein